MKTITKITTLALVLALAACTADELVPTAPGGDNNTLNTTPGTLLVVPGAKPTYTTTDNNGGGHGTAARTSTTNGTWQTGDVITLKYTFSTATTTIATATQTLTATTTGGDTGDDAPTTTWTAAPSVLALPTGTEALTLSSATYTGHPDALTATTEQITLTAFTLNGEEGTVGRPIRIANPTAALTVNLTRWQRLTALVPVSGLAKDETITLLTYRTAGEAEPSGTLPGGGVQYPQGTKPLAAYTGICTEAIAQASGGEVQGYFHIPFPLAAKADGTGSETVNDEDGNAWFRLFFNGQTASSMAPVAYQPGQKFNTTHARTLSIGTGDRDEQLVAYAGTADEIAALNADKPLWVVKTAAGASADDQKAIVAALRARLTSTDAALPEGSIELVLEGVTELVTTNNTGAFENCKALASVSMPQVTSIGEYAFYYCSALTTINLPKVTGSIGSSAFYGCTALTTVNLPQVTGSIGESAFYNCKALTTIDLPLATSIGQSAFCGCSALTTIDLPQVTGNIGSDAFYSCKALTTIDLPLATSIGQFAFADCYALTTINLPKVTGSIGQKTFQACFALTTINLPAVTGSIGQNAFYDCKALTTVILPKVTSIGNSAFGKSNAYYPSNITHMELATQLTEDQALTIHSNAFKSSNGYTLLNEKELTFVVGTSQVADDKSFAIKYEGSNTPALVFQKLSDKTGETLIVPCKEVIRK